MALLIDGYNLLHATDIFGAEGPGTDLHRTRMALLNFIASAIRERERPQTTIVFDASGAPPGLPRTISHQGMTVHFAQRHSDADEMIEELLEQHRDPRSLLVVSGDRRVQRAARHCGASYVESAQWYADMRIALRERNAAEPMTNSTEEKDVGDVNYWVRQFGEVPAPEDDPSPFPPGYGDDLEDKT
jgi:uncharacterized protein